MNLDTAYDKCLDLCRTHYENFPVARLVPKSIRKHVAAVYAFARTSDDIADEEHESIPADSPIRVERLKAFEQLLDSSLENPENITGQYDWIFVALVDTIKKFDIPSQLFKDLISAFAQDVVKKRYATFDELKDYCRRSANPVGRLVLLLHGFNDDERFEMSDNICTALQLANFWQDMSVDKLKDRIYIPQEDWNGLSQSDIFASQASQSVKELVKKQVERTHKLFDAGEGLPKTLPFMLRLEIRLTLAGGRAILKKIESQDYDTLKMRPKLNTVDKIKLLLASIF